MIPGYVVISTARNKDKDTRLLTDPDDARKHILACMEVGAEVECFAVVQVLKFAPGKTWRAEDAARAQLEMLIRGQVQDPPAFK